MVKISYTNIIVDEFSTARNNPFNKYIHFLTHIHADHIKGLSNSWQYGPIYCSPITKKLILLKFPRLQCLKQLQLDTQHTIHLSSELEVTVTLFDANHCAGSVILLIEGYMGTVLYSGDMRFDREVFQEYTYLYPHSKRNKDFKGCSLGVDFLYLDTTFLHPKFSFPPKEAALGQLDSFIDATIKKAKADKQFIEFYIGIDSFGKEEVLVHLAEKFQTLVVVSEDRYKNISTVGLDSELFTTDPQAGFIHVVQKRQLKGKIACKPNSMGIILTGWANKSHYRSQKTYAIPYSLHSSYPELVAFVDSIRPAFIQSIIQVSGFTRQEQSSRNRGSDGSRNKSNEYFGQDDKNEASLYDVSGTGEYLNKLRQDFCSRPSEEIQHLIGNTEFQMKIKEKLKLDRKSVQINREQFGMTTNIVRVENINRAGAKITKERNQQQIQKLKLKLKQKQQMLTNKTLKDQRKDRFNQRIEKNSGYDMLQIQDTPERDLQKSDESILDRSDQNILEKSDQKSNQSMLNRSSQSVLNRSKDSVMNRSGYSMGDGSVQQILNRSIQQKNLSNSSSLSSRRQSSNINSRPTNIRIHINSSQHPQPIPQEQDPQAARRNKWLKKVQQGEIDLFGKMPNSVIKINDSRKSEDTKAMNEMLRERIFNKGGKKKKVDQECIDLVDDEDNNNDQKQVELEKDQITLDMYRGARRERSQLKENSQNKINAINEIGDDNSQSGVKKSKPAPVKARFSDTVPTNFNQLFTLPSEKPADQRAITQFFTSPSKKPKPQPAQKPQPSQPYQTSCQNHTLSTQNNPTRPNKSHMQQQQKKVQQRSMPLNNRQADDQDDDSQEQSVETLIKRSQSHFSNIDVITSWKQCSMMAIDLNNLATDAKQADVSDYEQFFISK